MSFIWFYQFMCTRLAPLPLRNELLYVWYVRDALKITWLIKFFYCPDDFRMNRVPHERARRFGTVLRRRLDLLYL